MGRKRPKQGAAVGGGKRPTAAPGARPPHGTNDQRLSWGFQHLDTAGDWCWFNLNGNKRRQVLRKLGELEASKWSELGRQKSAGGCKPVELAGIPNKVAKKRLEEIKQDDRDHIWEIRLAGAERVWGFREGAVFYILWWDPGHTIWPTRK